MTSHTASVQYLLNKQCFFSFLSLFHKKSVSPSLFLIFTVLIAPSRKAQANYPSTCFPSLCLFFYSFYMICFHSDQQSFSHVPLPEPLSLPLVLFLRADAHTAPLCPGTCPPAHPKWALCSLRSPLLPPLLGSHPL